MAIIMNTIPTARPERPDHGKFGLALFMCILTRRNRIPETTFAKPARKKENTLRYMISVDGGKAMGEPPTINTYLMNRSNRS